jgi:uncharacterized damage-inducible protein DinB
MIVSVNEPLLEAFRHHLWATRELLAFCRSLSDGQLRSPAPGAYGSVLDLFNHIIRSDASYLRRLAGSGPAWERDETPDLDQLTARVEEIEPLWERLLSNPIDTERMIAVDNGANEVGAGVFVAQTLHHGSAHREQICAILTGFGMEPPDVQGWGWAWATGRLRERRAAD